MTDGQPDNDDDHGSASQEVLQLEDNRKLTVFPIFIDSGVSENEKKIARKVLATFSKKRPPLSLIGLNFRVFFEWLSASIGVRAASAVDERISLPSVDPWGRVD